MRLAIKEYGILFACVPALFFAAFFPFIEDPVLVRNSVIVGDNRENRLGSLTYHEVSIIEKELIQQTRSTSSEIRSKAIGQLVTMYRKRTMIPESLRWLKRGLKEFPGDNHLKKEKAKMQEIIRRNMF